MPVPLAEVVVTNIACGYYHSVVRTAHGRVYVFGRNDYGQLGLGHRENRRRPQELISLAREVGGEDEEEGEGETRREREREGEGVLNGLDFGICGSISCSMWPGGGLWLLPPSFLPSSFLLHPFFIPSSSVPEGS